MPFLFLAFSAPDSLITFATFSLPFPGASCLVRSSGVDYMTQHSSRQIDFRVKRPRAGYITMEAIGLVTWCPWLRPEAAAGSVAQTGAILPKAVSWSWGLKLFFFLLCSLRLGEE